MIVLLLLVSLLPAETVARVTDGDTVVLTDGRRIRLYGIDAPETHQPYGPEARAFLERLVREKDITVTVRARDLYGRTVAELHYEKASVGEALVRAGYAWWYRSLAKKEKALERAENEARTKRAGLWADAAAISPWEWRKGKR